MTAGWAWQPKTSLNLPRDCYVVTPPEGDPGDKEAFLVSAEDLQHLHEWNLLVAPPLPVTIQGATRIRILYCEKHGGSFMTFDESDECHICTLEN